MAHSKLAAGAIAEMMFGIGSRPTLAAKENADGQPADETQEHGLEESAVEAEGKDNGPLRSANENLRVRPQRDSK